MLRRRRHSAGALIGASIAGKDIKLPTQTTVYAFYSKCHIMTVWLINPVLNIWMLFKTPYKLVIEPDGTFSLVAICGLALSLKNTDIETLKIVGASCAQADKECACIAACALELTLTDVAYETARKKGGLCCFRKTKVTVGMIDAEKMMRDFGAEASIGVIVESPQQSNATTAMKATRASSGLGNVPSMQAQGQSETGEKTSANETDAGPSIEDSQDPATYERTSDEIAAEIAESSQQPNASWLEGAIDGFRHSSTFKEPSDTAYAGQIRLATGRHPTKTDHSDSPLLYMLGGIKIQSAGLLSASWGSMSVGKHAADNAALQIFDASSPELVPLGPKFDTGVTSNGFGGGLCVVGHHVRRPPPWLDPFAVADAA